MTIYLLSPVFDFSFLFHYIIVRLNFSAKPKAVILLLNCRGWVMLLLKHCCPLKLKSAQDLVRNFDKQALRTLFSKSKHPPYTIFFLFSGHHPKKTECFIFLIWKDFLQKSVNNFSQSWQREYAEIEEKLPIFVNIAKRRGWVALPKKSKSNAFTRFLCRTVRFFWFGKLVFSWKKGNLPSAIAILLQCYLYEFSREKNAVDNVNSCSLQCKVIQITQ